MAFSTFNSIQSFLMYVRASVGNLATFTYNFPALDPSLVLYYPMDSSANPSNGFKTANFASRLPVYDASLAGSSMITYAPNNTITSFGDLSLNNTMGSQLVAQTASGNYVVSNTTFTPNISGGFSISLWFSCSGQLNKTGTLISLPLNKTSNGLQIDISGPNMIYSGYNVPVIPIVLIPFTTAGTIVNTGSLATTTVTIANTATTTTGPNGTTPVYRIGGTSNTLTNFGSLFNFTVTWWDYLPFLDNRTLIYLGTNTGNNSRLLGTNHANAGLNAVIDGNRAANGDLIAGSIAIGNPTISATVWTHYAFAVSNSSNVSTVRLYRNGALFSSATFANYVNGFQKFNFFPDVLNYFWIYKLSVYDFTLTLDQIKKIYDDK